MHVKAPYFSAGTDDLCIFKSVLAWSDERCKSSLLGHAGEATRMSATAGL